jgi:nitroreductase
MERVTLETSRWRARNEPGAGPKRAAVNGGTLGRMTDTDRPPGQLVRPLLRVRQYRQFTDQPPTDRELAAIVDAARWSGSSRNSQPWRFVVLRDREVILRIHEAGLPQTRALATAHAALAIVVPDDDDAESHAYDEGRAAERTLIAASFLRLGAGITWILPAVRPLVSELLALPPGWFVRTIVVIGHPTEEARGPKLGADKARLPRSETVFEERWPADPAG